MSGEKQIEEMAKELCDSTMCDLETFNNCRMSQGNCSRCKRVAKDLYNAGYRKQSEVELRVETTTDDFKDLEIAKKRGYHRKKFYCPNCDLLIKIETWDSERMFGGGTILKSNEMPKFCPNCGAKIKGGAE